MDNSRFLKIVIIILLLINIGTLGYMWMQKPQDRPGPPRKDISGFLTRELNFTEDQKKQFETLRNEHHDAIENIQEKDREMHDKYFDLLQSAAEDSLLVTSLADSMSENRKQIELITFHHFRKVRNICDDKQKKKFDEIINDALRMMAPRLHGR